MTSILFKLGSRTSPLAMTQTRTVRGVLAQAHGLSGAEAEQALPIVPINTTGDKILDRRLAESGGKGLFTKELDEALADGRIDIAVHSMKDVPTILPDFLTIAAVPPRADPRDGVDLLAAAPQNLERGQPLQTIEEVGAEQAQGFILAFGDRLCPFADDDHEEGNQRGGDEEDEAS